MENDIATFREFDDFRLDISTRVLWHHGAVVSLPPKAVDLLVELTGRPGEILSKDEIMDRLWGEAFVEESNLTHNIYILRKTLGLIGGREYIETIPKRGYRFLAQVEDLIEQREITIERRVVSRTVIEEVDGDAEIGFGEHMIPTPKTGERVTKPRRFSVPAIAAGILFVIVVGAALMWAAYDRNSGGSLAGVNNIAVLPIRAVGNVDESVRFGLTDSLTVRLNRLGVFAVRPASAMLAYDHDLRDPIAIGRHLGLDAILDGRVQDESGRIRVNLQLIKVSTGENIWTGQFDGRPELMLDIQETIFGKLIADTGLSKIVAENLLPSRPPTENIEAYKAYHRGRVLFSDLSGHPDNWDNAVKEFETALALDPNFTLALTGLADVYSRKANQPSFNARDKYYTKALGFARRAVEADPDMSEAHISYAWIKRNYEWDFAGSEAHFRKALQLSPSHPEAHRQYSFLLTTLGRHSEAVDHARMAVDLDPSQRNHIRSYGLILVFARQYTEALRQFDHYFSLDPNNVNELRYVVWALYALGRDDELIERFESLPEKDRNSFQTRTYYALAYRRSRSTAVGDRMIGELARESTERNDKRIRFATTLTTLGEFSEALDILEEGLRIKEDRMLWVKAQPEFEALRGEPRYQAILREMKLAH